MEIGVIRKRTAIAEIGLCFVKAQALVELNIAALILAGVADIVDDGARRLRGQRGRRPATDTFNIGDRGVKARPIVVVAELDITEQNGRQAIKKPMRAVTTLVTEMELLSRVLSRLDAVTTISSRPVSAASSAA